MRRVAAAAVAALACLCAAARAHRFDFTSGPGETLPFRNVSGDDAQAAILEQNGQGLCALDYDGDGRLDLYLPNGATREMLARGASPGGALLRNEGRRAFRDVTRRAGVSGPRWGTGCAAADYDGDGFTDLLVLGWNGTILYRNRGDGTFEGKTLDVPGYASSAAFADLDGDGRLDLAISRYVAFDWETQPSTDPSTGKPCDYRGIATGCPPVFHAPSSTMVLRQRPDGTFEDVSAEAGVAGVPTRGFGVVALPLLSDSRLPDLYVACDQMVNRLFRNRSTPGRIRFEETAAELGAAVNAQGMSESGMGLAAGDVFEDGRAALALTNFAGEKNTLYRSFGSRFEDVTSGTGLDAHRNELGWGIILADLDDDSHLDAVVANGHIYPQVAALNDPADVYAQPMRLYAGDGRGRFVEQAVPVLAEPRSRRGFVVADLDDDGRLDLVVQTHRGTPQVFWNRSSPGNRWIRFTLRGTAPRDPMGARVEITLTDGSVRTAWHLPNQGYQSSQDPRVLFGLGASRRVARLSVTWPDGTRTLAGGLEANRDYVVQQGKGVEERKKGGL